MNINNQNKTIENGYFSRIANEDICWRHEHKTDVDLNEGRDVAVEAAEDTEA